MQLITKLPKTRRNKLLPLADNLFLHQRALIDTIHDPLKHISPIEPTRHRSGTNARVNLLASLVASTQQPKKPPLAGLKSPASDDKSDGSFPGNLV